MDNDKDNDPVNSPSHYMRGGIETKDYIKAKLTPDEWVGFCRGNALKYLSRMGAKGSAAEDAKKARVYVDWIVDHYAPKETATFGQFTLAPAEKTSPLGKGPIPSGLRVGDYIRGPYSVKWDIIEAVYGELYSTADRIYVVGQPGYWECN